ASMAHVFISYSRRDGDAIRRLQNMLVEAGHQVWTDQEIRGGNLWRTSIVDSIGSADAFIVALSQQSIKSNDVWKEVGIADEKKKKILPVIIEHVSVPPELQYQLQGLQFIDLAAEPVSGEERLLNDICAATAGSLPLTKEESKPSRSIVRPIDIPAGDVAETPYTCRKYDSEARGPHADGLLSRDTVRGLYEKKLRDCRKGSSSGYDDYKIANLRALLAAMEKNNIDAIDHLPGQLRPLPRELARMAFEILERLEDLGHRAVDPANYDHDN